MPAENPLRRNQTAKAMATRLGVSERTIRNVVAEPRQDFLTRARQRRERAVELRDQGLKYREIAEILGCSLGTVGSLLHEARKLRQTRTTDKAS